jgi:uncharacterized ParB-like nuclease family protein
METATWERMMEAVSETAAKDAAAKLFDHLVKHNYRPEAVEWVKHAMIHEAHVPIARIQISHTPNDPQKVERMMKQLKAGDKLPRVLLADTGKGPFRIADGHHRVYASKKAGLETIRAFVLTHVGDSPKEPWRIMHDKELNQNHGG